MLGSELELLVYYEGALGAIHPLPGIRLEKDLELAEPNISNAYYIKRKLIQSCRKLCLMWHAGDKALNNEMDFYMSTLQDSPVLFGLDAVRIYYHLEAMVLIGRSACDIATGAFAQILPDPFTRKRIDSLSKLVKIIQSGKAPEGLVSYISSLRADPYSWLSLLTGKESSRSLRDKVAHQMEFPLEYMEYDPNSDKEKLFVLLNSDNAIPLIKFINRIRYGVIDAFHKLEEYAVMYVESISHG